MQMPEMDGLAATQAIRARADSSVPILATTANAFSEDRAVCLEAGMNDYIAKPVDPELLAPLCLPAAMAAAKAEGVWLSRFEFAREVLHALTSVHRAEHSQKTQTSRRQVVR